MSENFERGIQAQWMPFTANRDFKQSPRVLVGAEGHYYQTRNGGQVYDAFSGLWTSGIGHCHPKIVEAVQKQVAKLDYAMSFQIANDQAVELAAKLTDFAPAEFNHCFFTNSGSESADTALKMVLAYHQAKGNSERVHLVGRQRGYHGVNFGGISIGGIPANRDIYSANLLPNVHHLPHHHSPEHNAFSKGSPEWGAHLADSLLDLINKLGKEAIAAVMVEPIPGSTGILPPPIGYLEKLRETCTQHGILLIFDEVISAFGRVGDNFGASRLGVMPDIITTAKGLTNGVIPMGAVLVTDEIYNTFMQGPEHMVELFHGYTYSGHPVAAAAGLASLEAYEEEGSIEQARALEPVFEEAIHTLDDHPMVIDVRNFGLMGAVELAPREGEPGGRGLEAHKKCFWDEQLVIRNGMDILQFAPFLNSKTDDVHRTFESLRRVLDSIS